MALPDEDKLLESIFPPNWYNQVMEAIDYAMSRIDCSEALANKIAKDIIDYNIEKRLRETLNESAEILLPKTVDWSKLEVLDAFDAFKIMIEAFDLSTKLKKRAITIKLGKNNLVYNELLIWKEAAMTKYPNLLISLTPAKAKSTFILDLKRTK